MKDINQVNFIFPSVDQIKNSALFKPIDTTYAMTYQSYLNGIENGLYNAWDVSVRTGYLLGQTTNEIVRNVLGGVSQIDKLKKDGTIKSLRNSIYSNTRTVLQSLANETRTMIFEENEKYFSDDENRYEYMATLDNRTCLVCGSLDGSLFKNIRDVKYQLPKHRGCRCIVLPYFEIEGDKKSSKNGYVDSKVTFNDWLKEQDKETQLDVLGRTRFELFKNGEDIGQFVDNGKTLTLAELVKKGTLNYSGGILDKSEEEQELFAKDYYREIRNRKGKSDIRKITKNTGFSNEKISAIRKHIFEDDKHLFKDGSRGAFNENAKIALAWQRLEQNKAIETDILLLNHEYTELSFMNKKGYNYEKSHLLANLRYPWDIKTDKRYKDLDDVDIHKIVRKCFKDYL